MFKWLTHRSFLFNLIAAIIVVALVALGFFLSLGPLTKHGDKVTVPNVINKNVYTAKKLLRSENFKAIVEDSAYVDSLPPLSVVDQKPKEESVVKTGRRVYLTVNKKEPPLTIMPNLKDFTFRSALMTLKNQKLKLGDTIYKPDITENTVLKQLYKNKPIKAGEQIPEGSRITLVLGGGLGDVANKVPDLIGLTYLQATELLSASDLNIGVVLTRGEIEDTANAFIFKQSPAVETDEGRLNKIRKGAFMDIWISKVNPYDSSMVIDSIP